MPNPPTKRAARSEKISQSQFGSITSKGSGLAKVRDDNLMKVVAWYDNERNYSNRTGVVAAKGL